MVRGRGDPAAWLTHWRVRVRRGVHSARSRLGEVGSWALIACAMAVAVDALRRARGAALPGLLLVPGAVLVHVDHIFAPTGVAGMVLIGLASGWLADLNLTDRIRRC